MRNEKARIMNISRQNPAPFPSEFELEIFNKSHIENGITICAIAKNESRYIVEWICYHLAIGVDRIHIYSNDTEDDQDDKLNNISRHDSRITWERWIANDGTSPQVSAYNDALQKVSTPWVGFIDIDEFIVPLEDESITDWLQTVPDEVSSVHINWMGFGSAFLKDDSYELVTRAFNMAAPINWSNHHHFKSIARTKLAVEATIHNIITQKGYRTLSDFSEFETSNNGISDRVIHHRIQINHYQCKTYKEFSARMQRGDANISVGPEKKRDGSLQRYKQLDLNHHEDLSIRRFDSKLNYELSIMRKIANLS